MCTTVRPLWFEPRSCASCLPQFELFYLHFFQPLHSEIEMVETLLCSSDLFRNVFFPVAKMFKEANWFWLCWRYFRAMWNLHDFSCIWNSGLLRDEVDLSIATRVWVGRREKAALREFLFKLEVEDCFLPMLSFTSLSGKRGEIAWTNCTGRRGQAWAG